jgi:hypothetical protein
VEALVLPSEERIDRLMGTLEQKMPAAEKAFHLNELRFAQRCERG